MILLFDIDGTLALPMKKIETPMLDLLHACRAKGIRLGVVGGSDAQKAMEQLGSDYRDLFEFCFHENGCVFYHNGVLVHEKKLDDFLHPDDLKDLTGFLLEELSRTPVPFRTGTFIERRSSALNVSPVGRACSDAQRKEFTEFDDVHGTRKKLVDRIRDRFPDLPLECAIGGMISIDIYPAGLNKTFALKHIDSDEEIHFFGDRCAPGGNDYEIYHSPRVTGHCVTSPSDTIMQLEMLLSHS